MSIISSIIGKFLNIIGTCLEKWSVNIILQLWSIIGAALITGPWGGGVFS